MELVLLWFVGVPILGFVIGALIGISRVVREYYLIVKHIKQNERNTKV